MVLLARLSVHSSTWTAALDMLILGLGLGMVMQVLVLAVQNAVDFRVMGVATSGSILFRQIGGSIGLAVFGAIFGNSLHSKLAAQLPAGAKLPKTVSPAVVQKLPPALHDAYVRAVASALHPVFVVASASPSSPSSSPGCCATCRCARLARRRRRRIHRRVVRGDAPA